jgi:hypothetical protein
MGVGLGLGEGIGIIMGYLELEVEKIKRAELYGQRDGLMSSS